MNKLWSDHVSRLEPYVPGEQVIIPDLLRLNTNENPYGPSPAVIEAIQRVLGDDLRLYPDSGARPVREALARRLRLTADQVFLGNGSDEVLAHVFNALFLRGGRALWLPDITYSFYRTYCRLFDVPHRLIPLAEDFTVRAADYAGTLEQEPSGIIFANPNAPTGRALALAEIEAIVRAHPDSAVVVDEAYVDFGAESAVPLIDRYENLLVIQTFSKSRALAGLRVGYALGNASLIEALQRVKDSFNSYPVDQVAQAGALAALGDDEWFSRTRQAIMDARAQLTDDLQHLGFEVLPSLANFVFARHPREEAAIIARRLRDQGILVRHFQIPRIDQYLRITVGTPAQCTRLCETLQTIIDP